MFLMVMKKVEQIKFPNVAPIKNSGVTSPPLKPDPNVRVVIYNFVKKSVPGNGS